MKRIIAIATMLSIHSTLVFAEDKSTIEMCQLLGVSCSANRVFQELPGAILKTDLELPSNERLTEMIEELRRTDPDLLSDIYFGGGAYGTQQLGARLSGLALCRELGFESIGAVVWSRTLRGVHCLDKREDRRRILGQSTAALCAYRFTTAPSLMRHRRGACGIQMANHQNHAFDVTINDEEYYEIPTSGFATDAARVRQESGAIR